MQRSVEDNRKGVDATTAEIARNDQINREGDCKSVDDGETVAYSRLFEPSSLGMGDQCLQRERIRVRESATESVGIGNQRD